MTVKLPAHASTRPIFRHHQICSEMASINARLSSVEWRCSETCATPHILPFFELLTCAQQQELPGVPVGKHWNTYLWLSVLKSGRSVEKPTSCLFLEPPDTERPFEGIHPLQGVRKRSEAMAKISLRRRGRRI